MSIALGLRRSAYTVVRAASEKIACLLKQYKARGFVYVIQPVFHSQAVLIAYSDSYSS